MRSESLSALIQAIDMLTSSPSTAERLHPLIYFVRLSETDIGIRFYLAGADKKKPLPPSAVKLIHLDEDVWLRKPGLVINRLMVLIGKGKRLFARKGIVARIDKSRALEFQEEHHLQQTVPGKYRYGLFIEGELMAIMVFSGGRSMRHSENYRSFECLRFCSKQGYVIVGGFSRLLSFFSAEFKPDDIMTYIDKDWSSGEKFEHLGFVCVGETEPQHFWVNRQDNRRISVKDFEKLAELEKENYYQVINSGSIKMLKVQNAPN